MKKFVLPILAMAIAAISCDKTPATVSVSGVKLDKTTLTLTKGDSELLTATVLPTDASDKTVTWTSTDEAVAEVEDGTVKAIAAGEATITVTTVDGKKTSECKVTVNNPMINGHEYVDLGLSVKWATMNIGAESQSDYGDYFMWGETDPKQLFQWETYSLWNNKVLMKYNKDDGRTVLQLADDAAHIKWGKGWRIPTKEEAEELASRCTITWITKENGGPGNLFTGPNGNSIFFPTSGFMYGTVLYDASDGLARLWTSTVAESNDLFNAYILDLYFGDGTVTGNNTERCTGLPIRPVAD